MGFVMFFFNIDKYPTKLSNDTVFDFNLPLNLNWTERPKKDNSIFSTFCNYNSLI